VREKAWKRLGMRLDAMGVLVQGWRRPGGAVRSLTDRGSVLTQHAAQLRGRYLPQMGPRGAGSRKDKELSMETG